MTPPIDRDFQLEYWVTWKSVHPFDVRHAMQGIMRET